MFSLSNIPENYPILLSFKPHQLDPVGQIRNGQNTTHFTPFCGCESITLNGEYWYNGVVSDDCQDSLYLTLNVLFPRLVMYAEVIPAVMVLCDNILGVNLYTVTEKQYQEMQNSNRFVFYQKYFEDFRETKRNIVTPFSLLNSSSQHSPPFRAPTSWSTSPIRCLFLSQ